MSQVHGADVYVVDEDYVVSPEEHQPVVADAVVSSAAGVVLMVRVADCVPVLLADVSRRIVAAVHAGRPGMVAGVVPNTVDAMRALGADRIVAWIGPHVCGNCYEVPEEMRAEVSAVVPESFGRTTWGTPSVDVGAGVSAQLRTAGIEIVDASRCTIEDEDLFSYRRQGQKSGRLAGLVWIRP
jgi:YfiH family protein